MSGRGVYDGVGGGYLSSRLVYKPDDRFHVFKKIRPYNSVTKVNQNNYTNLSLLFNILSTIFRFLLINFSTYLQSFRLQCFGLMFANTIRTVKSWVETKYFAEKSVFLSLL